MSNESELLLTHSIGVLAKHLEVFIPMIVATGGKRLPSEN
jgi:hypothetical protein